MIARHARSPNAVKLRHVLAACLVLAASIASRPAKAWYFPEHVVIARDAVRELPFEIRRILQTSVDDARARGLSLCPALDVGLEDLPRTRPLRTRMLRTTAGVDCVPFAVLPALAADHADHTTELRRVLSTPKGVEITTAAADEWRRFNAAVARLPNTQLERMTFVHELDVAFYFIDPGYELRAQASRAHFVDAGRSLETVVRNAASAGAIDNAVGQLLAHHLRSLELASRKRPTEALLEHAFAVHFLQDAFSAGHLVMNDEAWLSGVTRVRRRHDFFDAKGLRVRRATSAEPCNALSQSFEVGLPPCWVTSGDGHLGFSADSSDRVQVVRAVKKMQLELALALDSPRVVAFFERLGEREQVAVGHLFDPVPWWTLRRGERRKRPGNAAHARALVRGAARASARLREGPLTPAVAVGARAPAPLFSADIVADALDPCRAREPAPASADDDSDDEDDPDGECGIGRALSLGTIGASLLRPLLVELPAPEADVSTLEGEAATDHGLAFQLFASASAGALIPGGAPADFFAPALGVSMGLAYRLGTYLPGRRNRAAFEVNLGVMTSLHYDTRGRAGGRPQVTMLEQELRWPILWEALTSYGLPLNLQKSHESGAVIVLGGARVREILTGPTPRLWGVELEAVAFALSRGHGAYPLYAVSPEVRFYFGLADPSAARPTFPSTWGPSIGVTFTGGYATFL
jgi:hypothetical protein